MKLRVKRGSIASNGCGAICANCGRNISRRSVRLPWEHLTFHRTRDPLECPTPQSRFQTLSIGNEVYAVRRSDGLIEADVKGTVTDLFVQNGVTYFYVRWPDEADDEPPVWFSRDELVNVTMVGLQVELQRAMRDAGIDTSEDEDTDTDVRTLLAAAEVLQRNQGSGLAVAWGEILTRKGF